MLEFLEPDVSLPKHKGAKLHGFLSYLVKSIIRGNKYNIIGYNGKQVKTIFTLKFNFVFLGILKSRELAKFTILVVVDFLIVPF